MLTCRAHCISQSFLHLGLDTWPNVCKAGAHGELGEDMSPHFHIPLLQLFLWVILTVEVPEVSVSGLYFEEDGRQEMWHPLDQYSTQVE
jgi:hypothetical protein